MRFKPMYFCHRSIIFFAFSCRDVFHILYIILSEKSTYVIAITGVSVLQMISPTKS